MLPAREKTPLLTSTSRRIALPSPAPSPHLHPSRLASCLGSPFLHTSSSDRNIQLLELSKTGQCNKLNMTQDEFIQSLADYKLPFRDLRLLLQPESVHRSRGSRHPALLPRPSSHCYIFHVEHVKLVCFRDRCLVMNLGNRATHSFVQGLKAQLNLDGGGGSEAQLGSDSLTMRLLYQKSIQDLDFEHIILEVALEHVVKKFRRHLQIIQPALEMLLQQIEQNPETSGLKRLLAIKKSVAEFEQNVEHVSKVTRNLLADDEDMRSLYLSQGDRQGQQEGVELLLGSYLADLEEIEADIKIFIDMIEDTDQFISAHLDSVRNEIIKLSLFTEVGGLIMGFGAVVSGIFGMNLDNRINEYPWAFLAVCGGIIFFMFFFLMGFVSKYYQLKTDTSSAQSFTLLKSFLGCVDYLEIEKSGFKEAVENITGLKITDKESEYLFKMVDTHRDDPESPSRKRRVTGVQGSYVKEHTALSPQEHLEQGCTGSTYHDHMEGCSTTHLAVEDLALATPGRW